MVVTIGESSKFYSVVCLARPTIRTKLLITLSLYHCREKSQELFSKNISAKDIDIYPKEAYNKDIGSERIREKAKGECK